MNTWCNKTDFKLKAIKSSTVNSANKKKIPSKTLTRLNIYIWLYQANEYHVIEDIPP